MFAKKTKKFCKSVPFLINDSLTILIYNYIIILIANIILLFKKNIHDVKKDRDSVIYHEQIVRLIRLILNISNGFTFTP